MKTSGNKRHRKQGLLLGMALSSASERSRHLPMFCREPSTQPGGLRSKRKSAPTPLCPVDGQWRSTAPEPHTPASFPPLRWKSVGETVSPTECQRRQIPWQGLDMTQLHPYFPAMRLPLFSCPNGVECVCVGGEASLCLEDSMHNAPCTRS